MRRERGSSAIKHVSLEYQQRFASKTVERPTSAVLGTLSQKTSILRLPKLVCRVTDIVVTEMSRPMSAVKTLNPDRNWGKIHELELELI